MADYLLQVAYNFISKVRDLFYRQRDTISNYKT